ncbi:MAG: radical SAM protein [Eubacterium sp.]|nr:radical SAM protein [Eubacterium sp.]
MNSAFIQKIRKIVPKPVLVWRRHFSRYNACRKMKNGTIYHLGIMLTSGCNLNCRHCADLIPFRKALVYNKEQVIEDLNKLLEAVDIIEEVLLIGGEVFLYKDLKTITKYCIDNPKIKNVILTTNGSIIPDEEMLDLLKDKKVMVRVSGYPEYVTPTRKKLISLIKEKSIKCEDLSFQQWKDVGINNKKNSTPKELEELFIGCPMKDCLSINGDGLIFWCSREMAAYYTADYPTPDSSEYINVRDSSINELREKWIKFLDLKYLSTCDYCNGINDNSRDVGTGLQIIPKEDFVSLLSFYIKDNKEPDDYIGILDIIEKYRKNMADIMFLDDLTKSLKESDDKTIMILLNRLLKELSVDYRLTELNDDAPDISFKSINVIKLPLDQARKLKSIFSWNSY